MSFQLTCECGATGEDISMTNIRFSRDEKFAIVQLECSQCEEEDEIEVAHGAA